jgi:hypothetical protein
LQGGYKSLENVRDLHAHELAHYKLCDVQIMMKNKFTCKPFDEHEMRPSLLSLLSSRYLKIYKLNSNSSPLVGMFLCLIRDQCWQFFLFVKNLCFQFFKINWNWLGLGFGSKNLM